MFPNFILNLIYVWRAQRQILGNFELLFSYIWIYLTQFEQSDHCFGLDKCVAYKKNINNKCLHRQQQNENEKSFLSKTSKNASSHFKGARIADVFCK